MSTTTELHSQIASIVEVLANSAVMEICKAVEDGYAVVNLEMSRSQKENECLRRRVRLLELQVSRYRAEQRLKSPLEGTASGRVFPGVRLLRTGRDTPTGSSLQNRCKSVNRLSVSQAQKTPLTNLDQDPDQEVVTTTKTEPTESEEDSDLVIIKVEGSVSVDPNVYNTNNSATPPARSSDTEAQTGSQTEVSGSQTCNETQEGTLPLSQTKVHDKNSTHEFDLDVIVIDGAGGTLGKEDITNEKALSLSQTNYFENTWLSFQTPSDTTTINETEGTSSGVATSFGANSATPANQQSLNLQKHFQTFNNFSNQSSNTSQTSSQGSLSGQTFAQDSQRVRLFSCSKCPMRFFLEAELAKHMSSHRNRKYVCGLCGKAFVCRSQLEIHQNVHTGEKPFKCALCNSSFSHPSNLRRHMKLQHQHVLNSANFTKPE